MPLAEEIRSRREALELSREALAERAHVSYKTIERIELGIGGEPRRATLHLIRLALSDAEAEQVAA